ncbi:MAG: transcriptional regulator [Acidimicrobiales bacterium]|nr:transcriptional regulator [Acidimicrobiales bacterium]
MATTARDEDRATSTIVQTLDIIGDRWTLLILRSAFRGVRRFSEIQRDLDIAKNLLADRLSRLVDNDILEKVQYQDRPARYEYHLTAKGRDLSPALVAFMHWGDRWCAGGDAPTTLVHDACGSALEHSVRCPSCKTEVDPTHIRSRENT